MKTAYVLIAGWNCEGSTPLRAFAEEHAAKAAAEICRQYDGAKPAWPETDADEASIMKWSEADDKWRNDHPGGRDAATADYFAVVEVPFTEQEPA